MKKQIASILGIALLSTSAFASKARLQALGEDTYGSFFIDDARNVTLNPAMLNFHKDFVIMEWGDTSNTLDAAATPKAEGGMFKASGNMVYGLYFGDESNTGNELRSLAMGANAVHESNLTSFYVAGDAGVQWGVKFSYHDYSDETGASDVKSSATRAAFGVVSGDIEAFLNMGLSNTAEKGGNEFEGKGSFQVGVTYGMGDIDYLLDLRSIQVEDANGDEFKAQYTRLGLAKTYKLNDKATAWASAWYKMDNQENDMTAVAAFESKKTYLPVSMAVEVMVKDWLALRGSVASNVIGTEENANGDKKTIADSTVVSAGAGLIFGDLTIDGMIANEGTTTCDASTTTETCNTEVAGTEAGTLGFGNMMSRVSMTYKF